MIIVEQSVEWITGRGNLPRAALLATNAIYLEPGSNPSPRSKNPATKRMGYGTASIDLAGDVMD
jgi:hypothetical protein